MRINSLDLIRYGKFEGKAIELPYAGRDIHVIVGPNEAGKSTLGAAIVELLYSIAKSSPHAFRHRGDSRLGAVIEHQGKLLAFHRSKGIKATLRSPDDSVLPDSALAEFVGASDRKSFSEMFGLDHDRLVQGGTSILGGSDDLGKILFEAAAGVNKLGAIQKALDAEADGLWDVRKSQSRAYYIAAAEFDKAKDLLKDSMVNARDWASAQAAVTDQQHAYDNARKRHADVKQRRTLLERVRRLGSHLDALAQATARLQALGAVTELPADAQAIAQAAHAASVAAQSTFDEQSAQAQALAIALAAVQVDDAVLAAAADIQALNNRRIQYQPYAVDMANLQTEIDAHWAQAIALARQIGWPAEAEASLQAHLPDSLQRKALLRLVREHPGAAQALAVARQAAQSKRAEITETEDALKTLATEEVPPALEAAIARAQKFGDHEGITHELQALAVRKQALQEAAMAALGPWPVGLAALRAMTPPAPETIHSLLQQQQAAGSDAKAAGRKLQKLQQEMQAGELALRQYRETHEPVTREQVLGSRAQREAAWRGIRVDASALAAKASDYENLVTQADSLADQHHDKIQLATGLQNLQQQFERLQQEAAHAQAEAQALAQAEEARDGDWTALAQRCGLPPLPLANAANWLASRQRAIEAADALEAAQSSHAAHLARLAEAQNLLAAPLAALGKASGDEALAVLQAMGLSLVNSAAAAAGKRASLEAQRARAASALRGLDEEVERAQTVLARWQAQWDTAVAPWHFAQPADLASVEGALELVERIETSLTAMKGLRVARIDAMQANLKDFAQTAGVLASRLVPDITTLDAADIALQLHERLLKSMAGQKEADRLRQALHDAQARADEASGLLRHSGAALAPLFEQSGTQNHADLARAMQASGSARQLRSDIAGIEKEIRRQSDGLSLDEVRAEAAGVDKAALMGELEQLVVQDDELLHELSGIAAKRQEASMRLGAISGGADGARAEGQRQEALARMAEAVESWLKVRTASRMLKWSIDQYRDARQAPMLALAGKIFAGLTLGSFERLVVDYEGKHPLLQGRRPDGELVDIEGLSDGTRDQLYLALRLAALDMHLDKAHALPFIADDLFINYSDGRSRAGLAALGELSRKTQVLFLTHHEHLVPVIEETLGKGVNIVRL